MSDVEPITVGWREWVALPDLDLPAVKAKVDTGARTSAIHAFGIRVSGPADARWVEFSIQPLQRNDQLTRICRAPLVDQRQVTDSGGHVEQRYVIATTLELGGTARAIEMTLTERPNMLFRMLLGRTALRGRYIVDPGRSFLCGRLAARKLYV